MAKLHALTRPFKKVHKNPVHKQLYPLLATGLYRGKDEERFLVVNGIANQGASAPMLMHLVCLPCMELVRSHHNSCIHTTSLPSKLKSMPLYTRDWKKSRLIWV